MTSPGQADPADGGELRISITDWDTLVKHLRAFTTSGEFTASDERVVCEFPNAKLTVTDDGTVTAGMPLHAFERDGVSTLLVDHDHGELIIDDDAGATEDTATDNNDNDNDSDNHLRYTFRRP